MFKSKRVLLLASLMTMLVVFTACQDAEEEVVEDPVVQQEVEETPELEEEVLLSDWDGVWNNMAAYLDDEELEVAFEDLAAREEMSVEDVKSAYIEDRKVNFNGFIVEGDRVTFLDQFQDKGGEVIQSTEYEYKDKVVAKHGNFDTEWYAFETKEDGDYKILLLMPVHGEEALTHFHLRYGDSVEEVLALEDWYPTFISPNSTYDQIYEEITE